MPTWPVPSAISVGGDIQLRTTLAVPSVNTQPKPSRLAQPISPITATASTVIAPPASRNARRLPPQRHAKAIATNPNASSEGSFTCDDSVISTAPASSMPSGAHCSQAARSCGQCQGRAGISGRVASTPRNANSTPVSINPSIRASL
ncbi:hypothetical protein C1Y40_05371 [Mycobacterium talmoniae]|uniref:Uncharacterized protein n=1 Tax=Mycobacterium talmoniae TaxID=1858794 RepID=A0A2S8BCT1_9MYCO|nr:hypothetical protein C1Y40_05371 [Mycobacterium talmoniae]